MKFSSSIWSISFYKSNSFYSCCISFSINYLALIVSFSRISFVAIMLYGSISFSLCYSRTNYMVSLKIGSYSFYRQITEFLKIDMHLLYSKLTLLTIGAWPSFKLWVGEWIQTYPLVPIIHPILNSFWSAKNSTIWFFILLMKFESVFYVLFISSKFIVKS